MQLNERGRRNRNMSAIVVDVQPYYTRRMPVKIVNMMKFLNSLDGDILMFVNAEDEGLTPDKKGEIVRYWDEHDFGRDEWDRVEYVDKGYGYLRSWMDGVDAKDTGNDKSKNDESKKDKYRKRGLVSDANIIKTIRMMYQEKVYDSRHLFGGEDTDEYIAYMESIGAPPNDPITVNWTSVGQLKRFSGSYLMGGARHECLREVALLMDAFNIKYKLVDEFVYG